MGMTTLYPKVCLAPLWSDEQKLCQTVMCEEEAEVK